MHSTVSFELNTTPVKRKKELSKSRMKSGMAERGGVSSP
jgi:hypothetical protein